MSGAELFSFHYNLINGSDPTPPTFMSGGFGPNL